MNDKEFLLKKQNVVGVGIGFKKSKGIRGRIASVLDHVMDQKSIIVLVKEKKPKWLLNDEDMIPEKINGIKTDVIEVGEITPMNVLDHRRPHDPLVGGISAVHHKGTACTASVKVYKDGKEFLLQNAHCGYPHWSGAKHGDPIISPSPLDNGGEKIGESSEVAEIQFDEGANKVDACLVELQKPMLDEILEIGKYGTIPKEVTVGETVMKSGRTTGLTRSKVIAVDVTLSINYGEGAGMAKFTNQILTENKNNSFIASGDSSSLLLNSNKDPVGLVFAASPVVGICNPIQAVMDVLGFSFEGEGILTQGYVAFWWLKPDLDTLKEGTLLKDVVWQVSTFWGLNFRESPALNGRKISKLRKGTRLNIISSGGVSGGYSWVKVSLV